MSDIIETKDSQIPTSATSDFPEFKGTANPKSEPTEAKTKTIDKDDKSVDKDATDDKSGENSDAKGDETPAWMKREITIERNKRRAAEEKAKELSETLQKELEVKAAIEADRQERAQKIALDQQNPKPQRQNFDDPDVYEDAIIQWSQRQALMKAELEQKQKQEAIEQKRKVEEWAKSVQTWDERKAEFIADNPDFYEVFHDALPINQIMADAIIDSENGPAIAYYLGQNPDIAEKLSKMSAISAVKEIGKIEVKLSSAPATKAKPKPDPIRPVGSSSKAAGKTANEESMEEYAARRKAEMMKR